MKFSTLLASITMLSTVAMAQLPPTAGLARGQTYPVKEIRDADIAPGQSRVFSKDTIYVLMDKVFIEEGTVLTIQPGTVVKGDNGLHENSTALIVCMGGILIADGTAQEPIVMTTVLDDLDGSVDTDVRNGWGGLAILGKAPTNEGDDGFYLEGLLPGDTRALGGIGGTYEDSSGVIRYVSVRHAGIEIADGNELNSISMVGVGSKTVFEYVEVFACGDDGIEIWGGAVSGKHIIVSHHDDDGFDFDCGWQGKMQFICAISDSLDASKSNWLGEWDGDDTPGAQPFALWKIANATFIGGGSTANSSQAGIILRANAAAQMYNSIITTTKTARGLVIDDNMTANVQDSRKRFEDGDLFFKGNVFWSIGTATDLAGCALWHQKIDGASQYNPAPELVDSLVAWGNLYADPKISSLGYAAGAEKLDPRPLVTGGICYSDLAAITDPWFDAAGFKGAFGAVNWAKGWTALDQYGYFGELNNELIVSITPHAVNRSLAPVGVTVRKGAIDISLQQGIAGPLSVMIRDLRGRTVLSHTSASAGTADRISLNTARLRSGLYTVEVRTATGIHTVSRTLLN